jgi:hypothetical protein
MQSNRYNLLLFLLTCIDLYCYKIKKNGIYYDYSLKYSRVSLALRWYNQKGSLLEKVSNRKLVLFRNSLRYENRNTANK